MASSYQQQVHEGMAVWSSDNEKLGKVLQCGEHRFLVEKGFFFPRDYALSYDEVADIRDGGIHLRLSKAELDQGGSSPSMSAEETSAGYGTSSGVSESSSSRERSQDMGRDRTYGERREAEQQITMPLAEEQLSAEKSTRHAGDVQVRKEVVTEQRQVQVPLKRDEVKVERVPAGDRSATASDASFRGDEVSIPIEEEELELKKRPVVREEVRITKSPYEEQRTASADVRKEYADIREEGDIERSDEDYDPNKRT